MRYIGILMLLSSSLYAQIHIGSSDVREIYVDGRESLYLYGSSGAAYAVFFTSTSYMRITSDYPEALIVGPVPTDVGLMYVALIFGTGRNVWINVNGYGRLGIVSMVDRSPWYGRVYGSDVISERLSSGNLIVLMVSDPDMRVKVVDPYGYVIAEGYGAVVFFTETSGKYRYILRGSGEISLATFKLPLY